MTALGTSRRPGAPPGEPRPTAGGAGARQGRRRVSIAFGTGVVILCVLVGGLAAGLLAFTAPGRWQSTADIVFTTTDLDQKEDVASESRDVQDRIAGWAAMAPSDAVLARAAELSREPGGRPLDPSTIGVSAVSLSGTELVQVKVTSDDRTAVAADAGTVARGLVDVVVGSQRFPDSPLSRVEGRVTTPGAPAVDAGWQNAQWWAVVGLVLGFVVGLTARSLLRPGPWARDVAPTRVPDREEAVALNRDVMGDEIRALVRGLRTPAGRATVAAVVVSIVGYGVTSSMLFPLAVVMLAAAWTWRTHDARWSVAALFFVAIGVFPEKVDVVQLGPVTPTVLEIALVLAFVVAVRFARHRPRAPFTWPVLAIAGAAIIGGVVALLRGGDFTQMIDGLRAVLVVLGFFPVYLAFGRRPHQLVAVLLGVAGASSAFILVAAFTGWNDLLVDERSEVITGTETSSVSRLSSPVLDLWAPLLILLLSALMPRRPRWILFVLVAIGLMHQALSYNRSTWAPLILLAVAVALVTHGPRGLARRVVVVVVIGALGLGLAFAGVLGSPGRAIADRATSVLSSRAYGEDSLPDRARENVAALRTLPETPWVGVGMNQYYGGELLTYDSTHSRTVVQPRPYIHNQYLRIWLYMGVLGLLAYAFVGVRVLALTWHAWRRRGAGWPMVVVMAMGLACLAAQSILQTTLTARPTVLTTAALMAAAAGFAVWRPRARDTAPPSRDGSASVTTPSGAAASPASPVPQRPRFPAPSAGTSEE